jgi:phage repressor protein C with HTH and peptisase S24 domain
MAEKLGINRSYLSLLEQGKRPLSEKIRNKIIQSLRASGLDPALPESPPIRWIPVVSWAQAGAGTAFEELPVDWQRRIPSDCPDELSLAVTIQGDSMEPKYVPGDTVVVMPSHRPRNGSLVVAKLKDEGVVFKVFSSESGRIQLNSYNTVYPPLNLADSDLQWVYPAYQVIRHLWP